MLHRQPGMGIALDPQPGHQPQAFDRLLGDAVEVVAGKGDTVAGIAGG